MVVHSLLSVPVKMTVEGYTVSYTQSAEAHFASGLLDEEQVAVVKGVAETLDRMRAGLLKLVGSADRTTDAVDRLTLDYISLLQHYAGHIPTESIPAYVWFDVLLPPGVSRAAKSPHVKTEIAACLFNMASIAAEAGAVQAARAQSAEDMKAAMMHFRKAAGIFQRLEEHHADESVHDTKVAHLAAMKLMMLAGATHCTFLMQTQEKLRTAVAKECHCVYITLAAELRPFKELPPSYLQCAYYYAEFFKQSFWLHKGRVLQENSNDTDLVMKDLPSVLQGLIGSEAQPLPKAPEGSKARNDNFTRISDGLYDALKATREWLTTENRKVYSMPVPRGPAEALKHPAKRLLAPVPFTMEGMQSKDPLSAIPDHKIGAALKQHEAKQSERTTLSVAHVKTTLADMQKQSSDLSVASLLSLLSLEGDGDVEIPESLASKIQAVMLESENPPQHLHDQCASIELQRNWCRDRIAEMGQSLTAIEQSDSAGFAQHGNRWHLTHQPVNSLQEFISCTALVKEYQDSLELAKKQDAAVLECVKQEFTESLLSRPLFEHDRHIKQCKRSEGASAELHAHLLTLDGLVKTFDRQKEEADTFVTQLEEQSARRMSTLSSDVKAPGVDTTDIDERLQMNATAFEADVTLMNNHVEQMATTMTQLAETAALCSGLIDASEKEAASGEELSSEYIQRLDVAVATYRRVEVLMKEGQQFYVSMMDSTEKLCNRVTGFVVAVGAQQNELSRVLGLENRTNTQIQGDATLAQSMQQEEKTLNQQRVQEQINADKHYAQALNDPPAAPPAAPSAPVVYNEAFTGASAPPASPTDLPASGVPPPMQNPYMARHAW